MLCGLPLGFILAEVKLILLCCCNKFEMRGENVIGTLFGGLIYHSKSAITDATSNVLILASGQRERKGAFQEVPGLKDQDMRLSKQFVESVRKTLL